MSSTSEGCTPLRELGAELTRLVTAAERRTGKDMSRHSLSKRLSVSLSSVYAYLAGSTRPSRDVLAALLSSVGASADEQKHVIVLWERVGAHRSTGRLSIPSTSMRAPYPLPPDIRDFVGRQELLLLLDSVLTVDQNSHATPIAVVTGTAAVGKTALAVRWAHQRRGHFPDGILYVDLRGFDSAAPVDPSNVLGAFLRSLGVGNPPSNIDERVALYRSLLNSRRVLVFLDNAATEDQVRPLVTNDPQCPVLVTSRNTLPGLIGRDGARRVVVPVLSDDDGRRLIRMLTGGVIIDDDDATELVARCARLPLMIRLSADLIATNAFTAAALASQLRQQQLELLSSAQDERTAARTIFSWSYRNLDQSSAQAFRLLGVHPGGTFDKHALVAITGASDLAAQNVLATLLRSNLIEHAGAGRYRMHDLLRAYAAELGRASSEWHDSLDRLLDHYLHTTVTALDQLTPQDLHRVPLVPRKAAAGLSLRTADEARAWLAAERANLMDCVTNNSTREFPDQRARLAVTLIRYLTVSGGFSDAETVFKHGLDAARLIADNRIQAQMLRALGVVALRLGRYETARRHLLEALDVLEASPDEVSQAQVLNVLAIVFDATGDYPRTVEYLHRAHALLRAVGNPAGQAHVQVNVAIAQWRVGKYDDAEVNLREALSLAESVQDHKTVALAHNGLGIVAERSGALGSSLDHLRHALGLFVQQGDQYAEANTMNNIAVTCTGLGYIDEAMAHVESAMTTCQEVGSTHLEAELLNTRGLIHSRSGRYIEAEADHRRALDLARGLGHRAEEPRALEGLARALEVAGNHQAATDMWTTAADLYHTLGLAVPARPELSS